MASPGRGQQGSPSNSKPAKSSRSSSSDTSSSYVDARASSKGPSTQPPSPTFPPTLSGARYREVEPAAQSAPVDKSMFVQQSDANESAKRSSSDSWLLDPQVQSGVGGFAKTMKTAGGDEKSRRSSSSLSDEERYGYSDAQREVLGARK